MSRKKTFEAKINVVKALQNIGDTSYYHLRQLAKEGYVEITADPTRKKVPGSRGRDPLVYTVSGKGQNLIRLSASWGRKKAEATA